MKIKKKADIRSFAPDAAGKIEIELSNRTEIQRSASFVSLNCEICGLSFRRKASEARRNQHHYCGRGCYGVAQRRRVVVNCSVCSEEFFVKRSMVGKVTCCGDSCRHAALTIQSGITAASNWQKGRWCVGKPHPSAKLTASNIEEILGSQDSNASLGRRFGVTRASIRAVRKKHGWVRQ